MKIAIIILNFNGKEYIEECLDSLKRLKMDQLELITIVVDNNSSDESINIIKKKFPHSIIIENKENLGFAGGSNVGIRYALNYGSDYCLLLNSDTLVDKRLLVQLIKEIKLGKKIGIIAPKIYFAPGYEFHRHRYQKSERGKVIWYAGGILDWQNIIPSHRGVDEVDRGQYNETTETDFATGCCMLVKKQVFERIGLFDKKYFLYWEDVDFCQRARKAGFKIIYTPKAFIWHKNASSSGGAGAKTSIYYQTRNRLLFTFYYAPLKTKLAVFKQALKQLIFSSNFWQKRGTWDCLRFKFGRMTK